MGCVGLFIGISILKGGYSPERNSPCKWCVWLGAFGKSVIASLWYFLGEPTTPLFYATIVILTTIIILMNYRNVLKRVKESGKYFFIIINTQKGVLYPNIQQFPYCHP